MTKEKNSLNKSKRTEESEDDALSRQLAAYGERFLSMFEDAEQRAELDALRGSSCDSEGSENSSHATDNSSSDADEQLDGFEVNGPLEFIFENQAVTRVEQQHHQQQQDGRQRVKVKQKAIADPSELQEAERLERRAFMSSKAARIHTKLDPRGQGRVGSGSTGGEADPMSREEFAKMQREVELYGAAALDKKSRKRFEAAMLSMMGAKAQKSPRIPAKIGLGMARKAAQREARALEEAIDAGMVKRKGLGRKKKEEKRRSMDRGLVEDRGLFRAGVMKVRRGGSKRGR